MKRLVVGDIHGQYDKLLRVLDLAGFNSAEDKLYGLGDFCDRGSKNFEVIKYLMSLGDSFQSVIGNHDIWLWQYLHENYETTISFPTDQLFNGKEYKAGESVTYNWPYLSRDVEECWQWNGGKQTQRSFHSLSKEIKKEVFKWLSDLKYMIELEDCVLIHTPTARKNLIPASEDKTDLTIEDILEKGYCVKDYDSWFWDRSVEGALYGIYGENHPAPMTPEIKETFNKNTKWVICGHTPHVHGPHIDEDSKIINIDCGSFITKERYGTDVDGAVCILDIDTFKWWRSDEKTGEFQK